MIINLESLKHQHYHGSEAVAETEPRYRGNQAAGSTPSMLYFNTVGVNVWLKRFYDYWLRLLDFIALNQSEQDKHEDQEVSSNQGRWVSLSAPHRETMIELLLICFENDVYPAKLDHGLQQQSLDYVRQSATCVNRYLAENIESLCDQKK